MQAHHLLYQIGYAAGPFCAGIAGYLVGEVRRYRSHHHAGRLTAPLERFHCRDLRIHELLAELRSTFRAQRAYVSKFHNGDTYADDSEILRKSRTHEVAAIGVSYQDEKFQGLLISSVPEEMELVVEAGPSYRLVKDIQPSKFRSLCVSGGVEAVARCAIRRGKDTVAFVGLDFDDTEKPNNIEALCLFAARLESLL